MLRAFARLVVELAQCTSTSRKQASSAGVYDVLRRRHSWFPTSFEPPGTRQGPLPVRKIVKFCWTNEGAVVILHIHLGDVWSGDDFIPNLTKPGREASSYGRKGQKLIASLSRGRQKGLRST